MCLGWNPYNRVAGRHTETHRASTACSGQAHGHVVCTISVAFSLSGPIACVHTLSLYKGATALVVTDPCMQSFKSGRKPEPPPEEMILTLSFC